jgi:inorganic pyrophosphatase
MTAFRGGQVLGFCLVGLALLILHLIIVTFKATWFDDALATLRADANGPCADATSPQCEQDIAELVRRLFELVAGYGLGGSSVALFGRVGGGIYTKAADVGADLVGKTIHDLKEDDVNNPGTIADNVGDNVGDIAGMGADLFGSLAESTCAALVVSSTSYELISNKESLFFPLGVTAAGLLASFISVCCVHVSKVTVENVQAVLKAQIGLSTVLMTACVVPVIYTLPETFRFDHAVKDETSGVWAITEAYNVSRW